MRKHNKDGRLRSRGTRAIQASRFPPTEPAPRPRPLRRWLRRAGITSGFLILAIPLITLREVDRTPWDQTEEASLALDTTSEMHHELAAAKPAPLEAGWATRKLPTEIGLPLAGYGARGNDVATALGDPLFARALCLRSGGSEVIFVTADLLLIPPGVAATIVELCSTHNIAEPSIYFTATHTHCGLGGWAPGFIEQFVCGQFDPNIAKSLASSIADAIIASRQNAEPAEWAWLETEAPAHVRNRTVKGGSTDPTLEALAVRKLEDPDKPTGIFAFYGAHATCFGHRHLAFSPDYPGPLTRDLQSAGKFTFAAFAAGCVGSQSPVGEGKNASRAEHIGTNLARLLSEKLATAQWHQTAALATSRRTLPVLPFQVRLNQSTRLAPWIAESIHPPSAPFHLVRLDNRYYAGVAAEYSAMLSRPLRAEAKAAGIALTITPFNGDYVGYVLPDHLYDSGAYEAQMNFQGPGGGTFFTALIRTGAGLNP